MASLLEDDTVKEYAKLENYFPKIHEVMERYLGDVEHETRTKFARNLFSMATIAEVKKEDVVHEFMIYLRCLKNKYQLALITSAPEPSVKPILQKVDCLNLFDIIYKSPANKHPNKKELFEEFIEKEGDPLFYIGNSDKEITNCKKLGIKTISVEWVSPSRIKGDYNVLTIKEFKKIILINE
jgi:FMN phosphatase YigB (HAD superfamily)